MNKYIKKVMICVLVIVLVAATALVGCGEGDKDKKKDNNGAPSTAQPSDGVEQKDEITLEMAQKSPTEFFSAVLKNTNSSEGSKDLFNGVTYP